MVWKKIISKINQRHNLSLKLAFFDYITYIILGIIIGGRLGYVTFYNLSYFLYISRNLLIWQGGMSFHGGLIGVIIATFILQKRILINLFY